LDRGDDGGEDVVAFGDSYVILVGCSVWFWADQRDRKIDNSVPPDFSDNSVPPDFSSVPPDFSSTHLKSLTLNTGGIAALDHRLMAVTLRVLLLHPGGMPACSRGLRPEADIPGGAKAGAHTGAPLPIDSGIFDLMFPFRRRSPVDVWR
jgi:hypothetical protein